MTLAAVHAGAAERDAVVDGHIGAYLGGFPDHHTDGVVDEQPGAEHRGRVDIHPGEPLGECRAEPGQQGPAVPPQPAAGPVSPDGVQSGVAQDEFRGAAGGRVTLPGRPHVRTKRSEHRQPSRPANSGVLR